MMTFCTDRRLSFKARGILAFIVSQNPGWSIDIESLAQASEQDGREAVRSGMHELVRHGYVTLEAYRNGAGQLCGKWYRLTFREETSTSPHKESAQPIKGYVYVIRGEQYYKIGCTSNFTKRLKALAVSAPFPLETQLLIPADDMLGTEQSLHQRFANKRNRGEWFSLEPQDIEDIRRDYPLLDLAFLSAK